jgi:hypothetical protein
MKLHSRDKVLAWDVWYHNTRYQAQRAKTAGEVSGKTARRRLYVHFNQWYDWYCPRAPAGWRAERAIRKAARKPTPTPIPTPNPT